MDTKDVGLTQGDLPGSAKAVGRRTKERRTMARQKSEDRVVPQGRPKTAETQGVQRPGGGKGVPVNEQTRQLGLRFETAENPLGRPRGVTGRAAEHRSEAARNEAPKSKSKEKRAPSAMMEEISKRIEGAFENVAKNRGAPGPDGQEIEQVRKRLGELLPRLRTELLDGTYEPGEIRRVYIPKAGGQRGLGIPNVVDRMVQEAVRQVLEPVYEPTFHESSHGFRPNRSCHTAIREAQRYIEQGLEVVVDLDVERFFDEVNHQRLMARLAQRVTDKRVLVLVGKMLKAGVVMPDGVKVSTEEGVPQGSPLSPLLSNVVLSELDEELDRRGHRFVRYADDCNIYVRSVRAGQRVMASVAEFLGRRMRLKVNEAKSAVARTEERHFVGFRLERDPEEGEVEILLSARSEKRLKQKVKELTGRNQGKKLTECIEKLNRYLTGWMGFFWICTAKVERKLQGVDAHIRRRLRAIQLKQWKRRRTQARKLIKLGVGKKQAWTGVYKGRKNLWALSHAPAVDRGLRNAYFAERGLVSLAEKWKAKSGHHIAPVQSRLALG